MCLHVADLVSACCCCLKTDLQSVRRYQLEQLSPLARLLSHALRQAQSALSVQVHREQTGMPGVWTSPVHLQVSVVSAEEGSRVFRCAQTGRVVFDSIDLASAERYVSRLPNAARTKRHGGQCTFR